MFRAISQCILAVCTLFLCSQPAAFPIHNPVPGGIAVLAIAPGNAPRPIVHFQGQRVTVIPHAQEWVALVGIPLGAQSGQYHINIQNPHTNQSFEAPFVVNGKDYRLQRLTIRNKNKVNPNKKSMQRILREQQTIQRLKTHFTEQEARLNFIKPVPGRDTGRFGLRRMINGQKRNPHSGMDIAAPTGTPIKATEAGRVLHIGDFFFSGKVVYVDHGSGVISMYAHLSSINVRPGQYLRQGDILGRVGKTGRATGPHLHWSVYLNGEAIDPSLFIPKMN